MAKDDSGKNLRWLVDECEAQIRQSKIEMPSASFGWFMLLIFFLILLFPFLVFPLLSKIDAVRPYLVDLQYEKIEGILTKGSVQILFYALPVALVITHGISVSAWKATISEVM